MIASEVEVTMGVICFTVTDGGVAITTFVAAFAKFFAFHACLWRYPIVVDLVCFVLHPEQGDLPRKQYYRIRPLASR